MMKTADLIIDLVIEEFDVTDEEFLGSDTAHKFALPRAAAAVLLADMTTMKRVAIALSIGRRPHTTAASDAITRGRKWMVLDAGFAEKVKAIKERVLALETKPPAPAVVKPIEPADPPDVVEMRRMINAGTDLLRQAMLRERHEPLADGRACPCTRQQPDG